MLEYKGYVGVMRVEVEDGVIAGQTIGMKDVVYFEGDTVPQAVQAFKDQIDFYLEACKQRGVPPAHTAETMAIATGARYEELCREFPLRPIRSTEELDRAIARTGVIIDLREKTKDDLDYLDVLGLLIHEYESKIFPEKNVSGVELLKMLLDEHGMSQYQLSQETGIPTSTISDILKGGRQISPKVRKALAERFATDPSAFAD